MEHNKARATREVASHQQPTVPTAPSPLLSRLSTFLPQLQAANQRLDAAAPGASGSGLQIEVVPQAEEASVSADGSDSDSDASQEPVAGQAQPCRPHIEMDIACGVLELQDPAACQAAEAAAADARSLDDITGTAAPEAARLSQKGIMLPGGTVLSPPAHPCGETSGSEDEGAGNVMSEISTRRGEFATCSEQHVPDSCTMFETGMHGSDAEPTDGCPVQKKQRIVML